MAFGGLRFARLELKNILGGGTAKALAAALIAVPCLCAAFYLVSYADPFGSLDEVPVAVVNQDEGAQIDGEDRNVGEEVCEDIAARSDGLRWDFVSADEARLGMEAGRYYMVCTIPADFSENIASAATGDPKPADLGIEYDESKNALASQMGGSVWRDVRDEVADSIARQYWRVELGRENEAGQSMEESSATLQQLFDGMGSMEEGVAGITQGISGLGQGASALQGGLEALADGASALGQAAGALSEGGSVLVAGAQGLAGGTSALADQISVMDEQAGALASGAQAVDEGISAAVQAIGSSDDGLDLDNPTLAASSRSVTDGLVALSQGVVLLREYAGEPLVTMLSSVKDEVDGTSADLRVLADEVAAETGQSSADAVGDDLRGAASNLEEGASAVASAQENVDVAIGALSGLAAAGTLADDDLAAVQAAISALSSSSGSLSSASESFGMADDALDSATNAHSASTAAAMNASAAGLVEAINAAADRLDKASSSIGDADDIAVDPTSPTLFALANALDAGLFATATAIGDADTPGASLAFASSGVTQGIDALGEGLAFAQAGSSAVSLGASAFASATPLLAEGFSQLDQGAQGVAAGVEGYVEGASVLAQSLPAFAQGVSGIAGGASALVSGSDMLASASSQMGDGLGMVAESGQSLSERLADDADGLRMPQSEIEDKAQMMASPVDLDESYYTYAGSYATGIAPYFLAIGLWVGCLAAGFALRPFDRRQLMAGGNPVAAAMAGFVPLAAIGVLQALALVIVLQVVGIQLPSALQLAAFVALCAIVFAALMQALASFGLAGRLVGIVWLMLQVACVPGIFPIETAGSAFRALGALMPMTYAVDGARQIMFGTGVDVAIASACAMAVFALVGFATTCFMAWRSRLVRMTDLHPSTVLARS